MSGSRRLFACPYRSIGPAEAAGLADQGVIVLDVREDIEWRAGHVPSARHIPLAKSERARENRAYVRRLLRERQPEFAAALASVEQRLSCPDGPGERRNQDDDRASNIPF